MVSDIEKLYPVLKPALAGLHDPGLEGRACGAKFVFPLLGRTCGRKDFTRQVHVPRP